MAWDSQNRLASCTKSTPAANGGTTNSYAAYTYGADGLRRRAFSYTTTSYPGRINPPPPGPPATDYAYDGTMLVREGHAFGGSLTASRVTATYFQGAQGPCYRRDDTQGQTDAQGHRVTKARWYVYDGLGSVVGEVDPSGNLTSSPKYDVYGAVRSNGGSATSRQGFVGGLGHVSDTETGLIYMRARYYDPSMGRFISQDPSGNGNNWFAYCDNNPVNRSDASGKNWQEVGIAFVLGFLAGFAASVVQQAIENHGSVDYAAARRVGLAAGLMSALLVAIGPAAARMLPFLGEICNGIATIVTCETAMDFVMAIVAASAFGAASGLMTALFDVADHNFQLSMTLDSMEAD